MNETSLIIFSVEVKSYNFKWQPYHKSAYCTYMILFLLLFAYIFYAIMDLYNLYVIIYKPRLIYKCLERKTSLVMIFNF